MVRFTSCRALPSIPPARALAKEVLGHRWKPSLREMTLKAPFAVGRIRLADLVGDRPARHDRCMVTCSAHTRGKESTNWKGGKKLRPKQKRHPKVAFSQFLVARGGIEPPTQGFSILCSTD
jgi:hypothetical protein